MRARLGQLSKCFLSGETVPRQRKPYKKRVAKTKQTGSRIGGSASFPISKHQSIKVSYSDGIYVSLGGNYQNVSAAWQYSWFGRPN